MKWARLENNIVREIIPVNATSPSLACWYGEVFAAQCMEVPDAVEENWFYNPVTGEYSQPEESTSGGHAPAPEERLAALEAAAADADALTVDQEYRLILLELGVN